MKEPREREREGEREKNPVIFHHIRLERCRRVTVIPDFIHQMQTVYFESHEKQVFRVKNDRNRNDKTKLVSR